MLSGLTMHPLGRFLGTFLVALLLTPAAAAAQTDQGAAPSPAPFSNEQLEQLVAPIALYPDPLIAQILMASTYPLEVVQAARFASANPNLKGDQLDEELKKYTWDDSVKSLVTFPQVLTMMNEKLDWTQSNACAPRHTTRVISRARRSRSSRLSPLPRNKLLFPHSSPPLPGNRRPPSSSCPRRPHRSSRFNPPIHRSSTSRPTTPPWSMVHGPIPRTRLTPTIRRDM